MPLQNRVRPEGEIIADPARGTLMGNRGGVMHRADKTLGRRWASRAWITCVIDFKGRHEIIMASHHYTQLFFLDEATALAAGHRPCAFCRRADYVRFRDLWQRSRGLEVPPKSHEIDCVLHKERISAGTDRRLIRAKVAELPDGVIVKLEGRPHLLRDGRLWLWQPSGYRAPAALPRLQLEVLTPPSIVAVISAGYVPVVHSTATTTPTHPMSDSGGHR
jgi:hypothetical protein